MGEYEAMGHHEHDDPSCGPSARLSTHEAVCAERFGHLMTLITTMSARIGKLEGLVWVIAGAIIFGMAGLIVTLALRGHP